MATVEPDETSYAHAPTNGSPVVAGGSAAVATADDGESEFDPDAEFAFGGPGSVDIEFDDEIPADEDTEQARAAAEFRPDVASWALTPIVVLLLGPALAAIVMFLGSSGYNGYPSVCPDAAPQQCGGVILGIVAEHVIAFAIGWLFLWAIPWRRGMRPYRYALAVVVLLVLIAGPLRLLGGSDYY